MTADAAGLEAIGYTRSYHAELEPGTLRLLAALAGLAPPRGEGFSFCELGSGAGATLNALAAAHPAATFVGVDRHDGDVAVARSQAAEAGLANVDYRVLDIEALATEGAGLGAFDFVAMHGVWAWISEAARAAAARFAAAHLVPGGLLFLSYNALPGWAAVAPLRALLRDEAARAEGDPLTRARAAVARAVALRDAGAGYFAQTPAASAMLTRLLAMDARYVVHEHLVDAWHPMTSSSVAAELAPFDLHRVGQLPLWENVVELSTPVSATSLVTEARARGGEALAESTKDLVVHRFFRRDVFVRVVPTPDPAGSVAYFVGTPIGAATTAPAAEVVLPHQTMRLSGAVYPPLLAALGAGAAPLLDLARDLGRAGHAEADVVEAARNLLVLGVARPFARATRVPACFDDAHATAPLVVPDAFNRAALTRAKADDPDAVVLASRALGAGVVVPRAAARVVAALAGLGGDASGAPAIAHRLRDLAKLGVVARRP